MHDTIYYQDISQLVQKNSSLTSLRAKDKILREDAIHNNLLNIVVHDKSNTKEKYRLYNMVEFL